MADRICTRFRDDDGLDIGCNLVTKEYMLEAYPNLVPWMKAPGLWGWGNNLYGQLGDGSTTTTSSPIQAISRSSNWKQVSLGLEHSAAIKTDGTLWLSGRGAYGRLGDDGTTSKSSPVQTISGGTDWKQVSLGAAHSAAIKTDGTLWLWGLGSCGRIGNLVLNRSSPVQTISGGTDWKQVSLGLMHSGAIKSDGTLWMWGRENFGALGVSPIAFSFRSSPIQTTLGGNNWKQVSLGANHTAAIKTDGTLWLWGSNCNGVIGNNASPTLTILCGVQTVSGGTNWKEVSAKCFNTGAIKTDGTLWMWGVGNLGQLGNGSSTNRSSPVQTTTRGTNWRQISVGGQHTGAIKTDGTLWMWGSNASFALTGDVACSRSPIQTIAGGNNWRQVSAGYSSTMTIRDEGEY